MFSLVKARGFRVLSRKYEQTIRYYSSENAPYNNVKTSIPKQGVGLVTIHRPKTLNALSSSVMQEIQQALRQFDEQVNIGAMVLTGSEKAFAAGADINEMKNKSFADVYGTDFLETWSEIDKIKKPIISAVNGFALGGGCELAMMADIMYCSEGAKLGQPEIRLGVIPGAGGSQRLTRAVGKSRAMEIILTGNHFSGKQASEWGLAARSFTTAKECLDGAVATAEKIAKYSKLAVKAAKEVVAKSHELSLREGVEYERRVFHSLFGSNDQKIGMTAFLESKKAEWTNQ